MMKLKANVLPIKTNWISMNIMKVTEEMVLELMADGILFRNL